MGAVVVVNWSTTDPGHENLIYDVAKQLEKALGEPVDVDVGMLDDRSMPDTIQVGRIVEDERNKVII